MQIQKVAPTKPADEAKERNFVKDGEMNTERALLKNINEPVDIPEGFELES